MPIVRYIPEATVGFPDLGSQLPDLAYSNNYQSQQRQQGSIEDFQNAYDAYQNISGMFGGGGATTMTGSPAMNMAGEQVSSVGGPMTGESAGGLNLFGDSGMAGGFGSPGEGVAAQTGSEFSFSSAGPWAALAAIIGAKAEDTRKTHDISYEEQMKNPSRVIQSDMDRWGVDEKLGDIFGGDLGGYLGGGMRGGLDLASGDFSNAWESFKDDDPIIRGLKSLF